jgi:hypothetical protein
MEAKTPWEQLETHIGDLMGTDSSVAPQACFRFGIFCGSHASEVFGLWWKSWTGEALLPQGTAHEGKLYPGQVKTKASKGPIVVSGFVRQTIEAWKCSAPDTSRRP